MKIRNIIFVFILLWGYFFLKVNVSCQDLSLENKTDVSMFFKEDQKYIFEAESKDGDFWDEMGHHGPAVENLWVGYRIYFDKKAAIDIYSKYQPRLEIKQTKWYTSEEMQRQNFGTDYYVVGNTIGAGSIRLWESDSVEMLNPVSKRTAQVVKQGSISQINMLSEGIPYEGRNMDVLVRLTVFSNCRFARVEAFVLADLPVKIVTGLNFNPDLKIKRGSNYLISWGKHGSGAAIENIDVGAALIYNKADFEKVIKDENEFLCISLPTKYLQVWITSANAKEQEINTFMKFQDHVLKRADELIFH